MSTDYAEKERDFLASLERDTGRSLAAWMQAIADKRFTDKNETIDWLRQQGFMFSKASWLERIHENGGRPIYADGAASSSGPQRPAVAIGPSGSPSPAAAGTAPAANAVIPRPMIERPLEPPPALPPPSPTLDGSLDELLVKAKALQPLARHVLREIAKAVPDTTFVAEGGAVSIRAAGEYAVLAIGAKELKLGLALGVEPAEPPLVAAKLAAPGLRVAQTITHMAVLSDARQVNAALLGAVVKASATAKS